MSATLTMVTLAKIKPREGFNPRSEFADEQMAELVESRFGEVRNGEGHHGTLML